MEKAQNLTNQSIVTLSEAERKAKWIKTARWIYWTLTGFFGSTMLLAGVLYFIEYAPIVQNNMHLGYPVYLYKILGPLKFLGAIAILWGRFPMLKEWAYIGYSLNLLLAAASHVFLGDSIGAVLTPLVLLVIVLISYKQWKTGWM